MKTKMFICGMTALLMGMMSCKSTSGSKNRDKELVGSLATADNSKNSLDWNGMYSGIVPCADCEGIRTTITLAADNTFQLKQVYIGKSDNSYENAGKFVWDKTGNMITLGEGDAKMKYVVGEGQLIMLDREGARISGELANQYVLAKVDEKIVEKYWKLTELFGKPVTTPGGGKEAFMILKKEDGRVSGNSGCNTFTGSYTLKPGNRIHFSKMASTMMMCLDMETEKKMNEALGMVDNYVVNGDTLVLNRARMAPLARFVAVYL